MIITFTPSSVEVEKNIGPPIPSNKSIPSWYTEIANKNNHFNFDDSGRLIKNIKSCTPFFDWLTAGYTQYTWCDTYIKIKDDSVEIESSSEIPILGHRREINIKINDLYQQCEFFWNTPWIPKTPKGWSVLITHPNNRLDLPFTTLSGIIDSDDFYHTTFGKLPLYFIQNFSGLIPAGTPMFTIIPLKRENWKSHIETFCEKKIKINEYKYYNKFYNVYKKFFWKKKEYK